MLKKLSVFVDTGLRRRAEKDRKFAASPAFQTALGLPGEIVKLGLCLAVHLPYDGPAKALTKFADDSHTESNALKATVTASGRIEAVVKPWISDVLRVEMKFFTKAAKTPFYELRVIVLSSGAIDEGVTTIIRFPR